MVTVTEELVRQIMTSDMSNIKNKMKYILESCGLGHYYELFEEEEIDLEVLKMLEEGHYNELSIDPRDREIIQWINS
mgnify:FL=1|jgi:predicted class III extradiol MEMO1 family dioxygenase|tara:strand:+ start:1811 stop:2041 length:231 start_codon:yes stop_codon:yes gene_type:complete